MINISYNSLKTQNRQKYDVINVIKIEHIYQTTLFNLIIKKRDCFIINLFYCKYFYCKNVNLFLRSSRVEFEMSFAKPKLVFKKFPIGYNKKSIGINKIPQTSPLFNNKL